MEWEVLITIKTPKRYSQKVNYFAFDANLISTQDREKGSQTLRFRIFFAVL